MLLVSRNVSLIRRQFPLLLTSEDGPRLDGIGEMLPIPGGAGPCMPDPALESSFNSFLAKPAKVVVNIIDSPMPPAPWMITGLVARRRSRELFRR
jgi:hypothetical protein